MGSDEHSSKVRKNNCSYIKPKFLLILSLYEIQDYKNSRPSGAAAAPKQLFYICKNRS